jgi:ferredoxin-NADP reductase
MVSGVLERQHVGKPMEFRTQFLERIERTPTAVSYRFIRPTGFNFIAGQHVLVELGEKLVHPLSLSDCPEETRFIEFTKRMTGSHFCHRLESLEKEDSILVKGPTGAFHGDDLNGTIVMIAGGIGITPIRSILKSYERKRVDRGKIILIYGNLNWKDIAFGTELENLKLPDYRLVHVLSDTTGMENAYEGFITGDIILKEVPGNRDANYMVSGPPAMVEAIKKSLATIGIAKDRIRTDLLIGY